MPELVDVKALDSIRPDCVVALIPPIYSMVPHEDHIDIICSSMMATIYGLDEVVLIVENPAWQDMWDVNQDNFMEWVVKGISHETIHDVLNRMGKPLSSKLFDIFNGNMFTIDYTGAVTWKAASKMKRLIRKYLKSKQRILK